MQDWTSGYVADIDYTYGYYRELNPSRARIALLRNGIPYPKISTACELGFGQGISTNFHAAASDVEWYGTDFNPAQAGFARELCTASGSNAKLFDEAFQDFCNRADLPNFDYIGLHGIWSWISQENRETIVEFVRKKLNVGGILYLSYNTLPGWASFAPMRHLMTQHAEIIGAEGRGIASRIDAAMEFTDQLLKTNPLYAKANPHVAERLEQMGEHSRHYLAHEYFNKDWDPMHFATAAKTLAPAKVDFACSAQFVENFDSAILTTPQKEFLAKIPDSTFRQSVIDFMVNQQFRRDYWIKGIRQLSPLERHRQLLSQPVILISPADQIELTVKVGQGEVPMNKEVYNAVIDVLSNHNCISIRELLEKAVKQLHTLDLNTVVEAVMILSHKGDLDFAAGETPDAGAIKRSGKLNQYLVDRAVGGGEISYLVSPLTGGGIGVNRIQQVFIGQLHQTNKTSEELAKRAWAVLNAQGHRLMHKGAILETEEENLNELNVRARDFLEKSLPILQSVSVVK